MLYNRDQFKNEKLQNNEFYKQNNQNTNEFPPVMRALLVEDDPTTARSLELALIAESIICDTVPNGAEGVAITKIQQYDIIVLDIILGNNNMDGCEVILRLRAAKVYIPILILSGVSSVEQKVKGLGFGADDYMTKPYNRSELIARIQAIVRRSRGHPTSTIKIGVLSVNTDSRTVEVCNKTLHLTSKEYSILELLAMRPGSILTKEIFLNHLYGGIDEPDAKIIDVFMCKLRKKLADAAHDKSVGDYIQTVWGMGYKIKNVNSSKDADDSNKTSTLGNERSANNDSLNQGQKLNTSDASA